MLLKAKVGSFPSKKCTCSSDISACSGRLFAVSLVSSPDLGVFNICIMRADFSSSVIALANLLFGAPDLEITNSYEVINFNERQTKWHSLHYVDCRGIGM